MTNEWKEADRISERIVDMIRAEIEVGTGPTQILAAQCLALKAFISTAPRKMPQSLRVLDEVVTALLQDMVKGKAWHEDEEGRETNPTGQIQ